MPASGTSDGVHWATERIEASGNCTVRVLRAPNGPLGRSARAVHDRLAPFGLGGEAFSEELPLVALNVPADADLTGVGRHYWAQRVIGGLAGRCGQSGGSPRAERDEDVVRDSRHLASCRT
ncbi:DUF4265 domain-containing protein [Micromonospora costi]|uniref:DUF4265 domain-containing protein n=1 Tax=Micromonospora costi TaxID=1530042 RepID=UPI0033CABDCA